MRHPVATAATALVVVLVAAAILPGACTADEPAISDAAATELEQRVAEVRQLATAGQPEAALARVGELQGVLDDLVAREELTEDAAAAILERATTVAEELQLVTTTTTTTTTTAPPPPTQPPRPERGDDDDGRGNGNGNGRGERDEDD